MRRLRRHVVVAAGVTLALVAVGSGATATATTAATPATTSTTGATGGVSAAAAGALLQLGGDDTRLSTMGAGVDGWAARPAVAPGAADGELLVVWSGDDPGGPSGLTDEEDEIWAQRVSGATGAPVGARLRVSAMGPDGDPAFDAGRPAVAWNPRTATWLVVWHGDTPEGALVDGELEIWGRTVAADGTLGVTTRISTTGTDGDPSSRALTPAVAAGPEAGWLVAWSAEGQAPAGPGEREIWSQVVADDLTLPGAATRLSTMGPDGDAGYGAYEPAVAPNPTSGGWSVLWWGDDDRAESADDVLSIFGRVVLPGGEAAPGDDVLVQPGDPFNALQAPDLATDPATGEHLAAWRVGSDGGSAVVARRLAGDLGPVDGEAPRVVSSRQGTRQHTAADPVVAAPGATGEWLVGWWGADPTPPLVAGELEVWAQRLSLGGVLLGEPVRLSDMGQAGTLVGAARYPAVATAGANRLVVWAGDDTFVAAEADTEVYGQLVGQAVPASTRFVPLTPARVLDTREGLGAPAGRLGTDQSIAVTVAGQGGVPATGAVAVALNVTLANATAPGYVTVWPTGRLRPLASNLNASASAQDRANLVIVPLGDDGQVSLSTQSGGHLVADVAGWFAPEAFGRAGRFQPVTPARVFDTRDGNGIAPGILGANAEVEVQVAGRGGVPATGASAVVANLTLAEAAGPGFVTAWPTGATRPLASTLNATVTGDVVPNLVVLPVGRDGRISLYTSAGGHLVVDVFGWFTDDTAAESTQGLFVPTAPVRVLDTRTALGTTTGRMGPGGSLSLRFVGSAGIPLTGATAVIANLTVADAGGPGFLTAWPPPVARPNVSNVNATAAGQDVANLAVVGLSTGGVVSFLSQSGGHLVADVSGWFTT